ncbi:hypothetical protein CSUI_001329 [Cystoisospora suis]|uniref:Uncharacterized protein n=1 Tax=Cystoisospora suis TaxID=483139 RepID=A0A2C6KXW7_9APIC|nr:hypothetical protein CSUI_001329 [Cystoisospora suis]
MASSECFDWREACADGSVQMPARSIGFVPSRPRFRLRRDPKSGLCGFLLRRP